MLRKWAFAPALLLAVCMMTGAADEPAWVEELPRVDGKTAQGLKMECSPAKTQFKVGETVKVWCTITNTTEAVKPVAWGPSNFRYTRTDQPFAGGILPYATADIPSHFLVRTTVGPGARIIYVPAGESIVFVLTHRGGVPQTFKGSVVYDPLDPRESAFVTAEDIKAGRLPWQDELVISNEIEYKVVAE